MQPDSGFLIVKTFAKLYGDHVARYDISEDLYAIPRLDKKPDDYQIRYRGLDRDALIAYEGSEMLAEVRMAELEDIERCQEGFLFDPNDVRDVISLFKEPDEHEPIWARTVQSKSSPPENCKSIGFEPSFFIGDHFSASCDCMLFPRWHGTDVEGALFMDYFHKLNQYGMFDSAEEASDFLKFYLLFDWTETGDYEIVEVLYAGLGMN